jgi:hypothetical protein
MADPAICTCGHPADDHWHGRGNCMTSTVEQRWACGCPEFHSANPQPDCRILWNVRGEDIDEIVVTNSTVHIEQMNDRCWWIGIDLPNGGYWAGNFTCDSRGRMRFWEQESAGFEWGRDDAHREANDD